MLASKLLSISGLIIDIIGVAVLFAYAKITEGATTPADKDFLAERKCGQFGVKLYKNGYICLGIGFLGQLIGYLVQTKI